MIPNAPAPPAGPRIITLTTDFGQADGYTGTMKGVILARAPGAQIVDISHAIAPQDIHSGAFVLCQAAAYFPPGTIHVAVVDPGVGSTRRALVLATEDACFVGPDNGLFTYVLRAAAARAAGVEPDPEAVPPVWDPAFDLDATLAAGDPARLPQAYALTDPAYWLPGRSATFHGRDVFAPVAAHLALGVPPARFGPPLPLHTLTHLPDMTAHRLPGAVEGRVIHIDHFGNLITNIAAALLAGLGPPATLPISVDRYRLRGVVATYAAAPAGQPVALINSAGLLEIAVRDGHAARELGLGLGALVVCQQAAL